MAYWYTYPVSSSDSDVDIDDDYEEEIDPEVERQFFDCIGNHPRFYAFHEKDYIAWNMQLTRPYFISYGLRHFNGMVDLETLSWIKQGISNYRKRSLKGIRTGDFHLDKDDLKFIFQKADEWMQYKKMDRCVTNREYLSTVCWVVSRLISFQIKHR